MERAALLARACAECPEFEGKGHIFKQMYLVCLCSASAQEPLMEEVSYLAQSVKKNNVFQCLIVRPVVSLHHSELLGLLY